QHDVAARFEAVATGAAAVELRGPQRADEAIGKVGVDLDVARGSEVQVARSAGPVPRGGKLELRVDGEIARAAHQDSRAHLEVGSQAGLNCWSMRCPGRGVGEHRVAQRRVDRARLIRPHPGDRRVARADEAPLELVDGEIIAFALRPQKHLAAPLLAAGATDERARSHGEPAARPVELYRAAVRGEVARSGRAGTRIEPGSGGDAYPVSADELDTPSVNEG